MMYLITATERMMIYDMTGKRKMNYERGKNRENHQRKPIFTITLNQCLDETKHNAHVWLPKPN